MPAPIDRTICHGPGIDEEHMCGRPVIAILKPSGRRTVQRHSCYIHIVYYLIILREYTRIDRLVVIFINEISYPELESREAS
jgi:hypothetical protein